MENTKLIKSFIVKKQNSIFKLGDIITLRKYQGLIPLKHEELYFESKLNGKNFTLNDLLSCLKKNLDVHEKFKCLDEKFDYVS